MVWRTLSYRASIISFAIKATEVVKPAAAAAVAIGAVIVIEPTPAAAAAVCWRSRGRLGGSMNVSTYKCTYVARL